MAQPPLDRDPKLTQHLLAIEARSGKLARMDPTDPTDRTDRPASAPTPDGLGSAAPVRLMNPHDQQVQDRGTIVLEDLRDILHGIAYQEGPNGPQSPITQYILCEGAAHLAAALAADVTGAQGEVPAVLATLLGHDSFATRVLDISRNHMRRRWPLASAWYADLIAYALRPQRYSINAMNLLQQVPVWMDGPLGVLIAEFASAEVESSQDPHLYRLGDTIMTLWPDYPPVRQALRVYRESVSETWAPVYEGILARYGLRLRHGVDINDACWVFQALVIREGQERRIDADTRTSAIPGVAQAPLSALAILTYVAGAATTLDGRTLDYRQLAELAPVTSSPTPAGNGHPSP
jgi:hypothetical protein